MTQGRRGRSCIGRSVLVTLLGRHNHVGTRVPLAGSRVSRCRTVRGRGPGGPSIGWVVSVAFGGPHNCVRTRVPLRTVSRCRCVRSTELRSTMGTPVAVHIKKGTPGSCVHRGGAVPDLDVPKALRVQWSSRSSALGPAVGVSFLGRGGSFVRTTVGGNNFNVGMNPDCVSPGLDGVSLCSPRKRNVSFITETQSRNSGRGVRCNRRLRFPCRRFLLDHQTFPHHIQWTGPGGSRSPAVYGNFDLNVCFGSYNEGPLGPEGVPGSLVNPSADPSSPTLSRSSSLCVANLYVLKASRNTVNLIPHRRGGGWVDFGKSPSDPRSVNGKRATSG